MPDNPPPTDSSHYEGMNEEELYETVKQLRAEAIVDPSKEEPLEVAESVAKERANA